MGSDESNVIAVCTTALVLVLFPSDGRSQQVSEVVDGSTRCEVGGTRMGCCDSSRFMTGVHFDNGQLLCGQFPSTAPAMQYLDRGTRRLDQRTCRQGYAMVGVHGSNQSLACAFVRIGLEKGEHVVDGETNTRNGIGACPPGEVMTGTGFNEKLVCAPLLPTVGPGVSSSACDKPNVVEAKAMCDFGTPMRCCEDARFATGVHLGDGKLLCEQFGLAPAGQLASSGTRRLGVPTCPPGMAVVGLHKGNQSLTCAPLADGLERLEHLVDGNANLRCGMGACPAGEVMTGTGFNQWLVCASLPPVSTSTTLIRPRYKVLSIIYAPPGANGGKSSSSVEYGEGSATGATTTTANSFKAGTSLTVTAGGSFLLGGSMSASFNVAANTTYTDAIDMKKSQTWSVSVTGPLADGINHDNDLYYLWLNPMIRMSTVGGQVTWGYAAEAGPMKTQYVSGAWLKNPGSMPPGLRYELTKAGLTVSDYDQILSLNPFSRGETAIDLGRYWPLDRTVPYEPVEGASPLNVFVQKNDVTNTSSEKTELTYGVGYQIEAGATIAKVIESKLKTSTTLEWTDISTVDASSTSSQFATFSIGGPAPGYTGPTNLQVYWDSVYGTFMFAFDASSPVSMGVVTDELGHLAPGVEVSLSASGRTYRTFTNARGEYRFYGPSGSSGVLSVGSSRREIALGADAPMANMVVAHFTGSGSKGPEIGIDRPGGDYRRYPETDSGRCAKACDDDLVCLAYTYEREAGDCWLKSAVSPRVAKTGCISGLKGGSKAEVGIDRPGRDYASLPETDSARCEQICSNDAACMAYTYDLAAKRCWLKSDTPAGMSRQHCISGLATHR